MSFGDFGGGGGFGSSSSSKTREMQPFSSGNDGDSRYIRLSDRIAANITQINSQVGSLERFVRQIGTTSDSPQIRENLSSLQRSTTQLIKETNINLQQLGQLDGGVSSDRQHRRLQQERLKNNFRDAISKFSIIEKRAQEKQRESVNRARRAASFTGSVSDDGDEDERLLNSRRGDQLVRLEQDELDLQTIQERESALRQLESDIMDVNEIFRDLGAMVHEQGEMIDTIESNVESAAANVDSANDELIRAARYQKKARKKKCICLILLLIILGVVAIIIAVVAKD